jgi:hypothetical protein
LPVFRLEGGSTIRLGGLQEVKALSSQSVDLSAQKRQLEALMQTGEEPDEESCFIKQILETLTKIENSSNDQPSARKEFFEEAAQHFAESCVTSNGQPVYPNGEAIRKILYSVYRNVEENNIDQRKLKA